MLMVMKIIVFKMMILLLLMKMALIAYSEELVPLFKHGKDSSGFYNFITI